MYTLAKEFKFIAKIDITDVFRECRLIIEQTSVCLNRDGVVRNISDLVKIEQFLNNYIDGNELNDLFYFKPTLENLAKYFFKRFKKEFPLISAVYLQMGSVYVRYVNSHDEEDHIIVKLKTEK